MCLAWVYAHDFGISYRIFYLPRLHPGLYNVVAYNPLLGENSPVRPQFGLALLISSCLWSADFQGPGWETILTMVWEYVLKLSLHHYGT